MLDRSGALERLGADAVFPTLREAVSACEARTTNVSSPAPERSETPKPEGVWIGCGRRPVGLLLPTEAAGVHLDEASQLFERLRVVVHLEPQDDVVVQPGATVFLDDEHRGGLHAAGIAAR